MAGCLATHEAICNCAKWTRNKILLISSTVYPFRVAVNNYIACKVSLAWPLLWHGLLRASNVTESPDKAKMEASFKMNFSYANKHLNHVYCPVVTYTGRTVAVKRCERLRGVLSLKWVKEFKKRGTYTEKEEETIYTMYVLSVWLRPLTGKCLCILTRCCLPTVAKHFTIWMMRKICLQMRPPFQTWPMNFVGLGLPVSQPDTWRAPDFQRMDAQLTLEIKNIR